MKKLLIIIFSLMFITNFLYAEIWEQKNKGLGIPYSISNITLLANDSTFFIFLGRDFYISKDTGNTFKYKYMDSLGYRFMSLNKNRLFRFTSEGLYLSTDDGDSWELSELTDQNISFFTANRDNLLAMSRDSVYYSFDNGIKWQSYDYSAYKKFIDIAIYGNKIFAISADSLYISTDLGNTWKVQNLDTISEKDRTLTSIEADSNIIAIGSYKCIHISRDGGSEWEIIKKFSSHPTNDLYSISIRIIKGSCISLSGSFQGDLLSTDYGLTWSNIWPMNADVIPAFIGTNIFATTGNGEAGENMHIGVSKDGGTTWDLINFGKIQINSLEYHNGKLYAGTSASIFVSENNGESWDTDGLNMDEAGMPLVYILSITSNGQYIIACTSSYIYGYYNSSLFNGWVGAYPYGSGKYVIKLAANGNNFYAGLGNGIDIFNIDTLYHIFIELARSGLDGYSVYSISFVGDYIYAGTNYGVFRSTDNGITWIHLGMPGVRVIALSTNENYIFAGTQNGIYISDDQGKTFYLMALDTLIIETLFDYRGHIFAGTSDGVYLLRNGGDFFEPIGLKSQIVKSFEINEGYIFAGTLYGGVFRAKLLDILDVKDEYVDSHFRLFPHPARDYITVDAYLGWQYQIYDLLGNCVQSGMIESDKININQLSAGFYTVRFFNGGKQVVEKMMKE